MIFYHDLQETHKPTPHVRWDGMAAIASTPVIHKDDDFDEKKENEVDVMTGQEQDSKKRKLDSSDAEDGHEHRRESVNDNNQEELGVPYGRFVNCSLIIWNYSIDYLTPILFLFISLQFNFREEGKCNFNS